MGHPARLLALTFHVRPVDMDHCAPTAGDYGDAIMRRQLRMKLPAPRGGRPPCTRKGYVPHRRRPALNDRTVVHVTLRVGATVPNLRSDLLMRVFWRACGDARARFETYVSEYSVQTNHIHLVVEAKDAQFLGRGMKGFCVRLARRYNKALGRRGGVFPERYHAEQLTKPRRVRNVLRYVIQNWRKHGHAPAAGQVDPCSSARWFAHWAEVPADERPAGQPPHLPSGASPLCPPRTWLLRTGWLERGGGPLRLDEGPVAVS